jgi:hypothetical protein
LECAVLAFSRARAQSAKADGARARNRKGFSELDYKQEQEHETRIECVQAVRKRVRRSDSRGGRVRLRWGQDEGKLADTTARSFVDTLPQNTLAPFSPAGEKGWG